MVREGVTLNTAAADGFARGIFKAETSRSKTQNLDALFALRHHILISFTFRDNAHTHQKTGKKRKDGNP
jgi:hypothetical protein